MTTNFKELLAEYAEQARPYEVREQALRLGRRRRRVRLAMPAGLVILSLVATGLALASLRPRPDPQPAEPPPSVPAPVELRLPDSQVGLPGYPAEIVTDSDAPPLPADQPVGRGLTVYTNPAGPWFGLVTETGAQYRLDPLDNTNNVLSPAGRWLASYTSTEIVQDGAEQRIEPTMMQLRDLTGTAMATLPLDGHPGFWWSTDDRWLLTATLTYRRPNPPEYEYARLIDLSQATPTSQQVDLQPWPGFAPASVRTDGTLVLRSTSPDRLGDLVLVDPASGDGQAVSIDLSTAAAPDELAAVAAWQGMLMLAGEARPLPMTPDGLALLQLDRAFGGAPLEAPTVPTDVLVLDLDAGVVRERWELPEPRPIISDLPDQWETWRIEAVLPEGLLLAHWNTQRRVAWELYDPETGALFLVTDLRGLTSAKDG